MDLEMCQLLFSVSPTARFQSMNWPIIKATSLALVIQFLVQFSGANAVSAYAVNMAETVGFTAEPYLPAVSITALRIGGSILSLLILRFHSFYLRAKLTQVNGS